MRLLALSDIHHHVEDLHRLRAIETNRFDAVVVAGDMGGTSAGEILRILGTFGCPVAYVLGNWDSTVPYDADFPAPAWHLHHRPLFVEGFCLIGYSGCPASWGLNPLAAAARAAVRARHAAILSEEAAARRGPVRTLVRASPAYTASQAELRDAERDLPRQNAVAATEAALVAGADPARTVFVSHERTGRLHTLFPGLALHLFGHNHGFRRTCFQGLEAVNVSAIDHRGDDPSAENPGTYTVIEITGRADFDITAHRVW